MNEMQVSVRVKDIRKAACAVGFGLTIGKYAGDVVNAGIASLIIGFFKYQAKKGNKFAQGCCDEADIKYNETKKTDEDEPKMKMGFNC